MGDIVDIAAAQIGISETNDGHMKYVNWYGGFGRGVSWCAIFVSWCANQAGVSTSVIPKYASVSNGMQWFQNQGLFQKKGVYQPKRGDLVFFKNKRSHTGMVEKTEGGKFYTIEGNSGSQVKRRNYFLTEDTLTGFGTPNYTNIRKEPSNQERGFSEKQRDVTQEISYLKKVLEEKKPTKRKDLEAKEGVLAGKSITIVIQNGKKEMEIPVLDGVNLAYERKGVPGKLTFQTIISETSKIQEGNGVLLVVDSINIFYGFVFTKERNKDEILNITAYDQLRYLKNKDFYNYENKTTGQLIKMIAEDYHLQTGTLADTKHPITRVENNITLLDMIQNSLDAVLMEKGEIYVLYDATGKIILKNCCDMIENSCLIDRETVEDFSYQSSIDSDVYNQIKLGYENKEKGELETYIEKSGKNINQWGLLQYFEKIDSPDIGKLKAQALLKIYNQKKRTLSVSGAFGNSRVRGGSLIPIVLELGDVKVNNYMLVEKVTHKFNQGEYRMDLILSGGIFHG